MYFVFPLQRFFFCCRRDGQIFDGGYLQSCEKRDEFCFWIQRGLFAGMYPFPAEAGSDQPESPVCPGYVAGPSRPRSVASYCLSNLADRDWLSR